MTINKRFASNHYVDRLGAARRDISGDSYFATPRGVTLPLLLDKYPGAAAAYSLRKLRAGYTGSAIRVRRSGDSAEQDIGFTTSGDLDESALTTFCGAGDGFVTTWYDQENSVDVTQVTAGNQPQIVSSGSVIKRNSKPTVEFNSTSGTYLSAPLSMTQPMTSFVLGQVGTAAGPAQRFFDFRGARYLVGWQAPSTFIHFANTVSGYTESFPASGLWSSFVDGVNSLLRKNGVQQVAGDAGSSDPANKLYIGCTWIGSPEEVLNGNIEELVFYDSDQTSNFAGIEANINDYWSVY